MSTANFPRYVNFDPTPIGSSRTKTLTLQCDIPVEFEYQLTYIQKNPAFAVKEMKGILIFPFQLTCNYTVLYRELT